FAVAGIDLIEAAGWKAAPHFDFGVGIKAGQRVRFAVDDNDQLLDNCCARDARTDEDETQKQPSDEGTLRHRHLLNGTKTTNHATDTILCLKSQVMGVRRRSFFESRNRLTGL